MHNIPIQQLVDRFAENNKWEGNENHWIFDKHRQFSYARDFNMAFCYILCCCFNSVFVVVLIQCTLISLNENEINTFFIQSDKLIYRNVINFFVFLSFFYLLFCLCIFSYIFLHICWTKGQRISCKFLFYVKIHFLRIN